jgi:predicted flap endonuclease-1-like 5' DNA nuclease
LTLNAARLRARRIAAYKHYSKGAEVKLRTILSVKRGGAWLPIGSIIDAEKDEARELIEKKAAQPVDTGAPTVADPQVDPQGSSVEDLCKLDGVNKKVAKKLIAAGYTSADKMRDEQVSADDLAEIPGIGSKIADRIIDALNAE